MGSNGTSLIQILKACGLSAGCSFLSQEAKLCTRLGGAELGGPNARVKVSGLTAESTALTSSSGNKTDIQQTAQPALRPGPICSESLLTTHMGQQTRALLCPPQPTAHWRPGALQTGCSVCAPPLLPPWGHLPALRLTLHRRLQTAPGAPAAPGLPHDHPHICRSLFLLVSGETCGLLGPCLCPRVAGPPHCLDSHVIGTPSER